MWEKGKKQLRAQANAINQFHQLQTLSWNFLQDHKGVHIADKMAEGGSDNNNHNISVNVKTLKEIKAIEAEENALIKDVSNRRKTMEGVEG